MGTTLTHYFGQLVTSLVCLTKALNQWRRQLLDKITPDFVRKAVSIWKQGGWRAVVKTYGWKFFAIFFVYYLVRDILIYLILPYFIFAY